MITREQLADLQPGDVVEITWPEDGSGEVTRSIRGPLHRRGSNYLYVGSMTVVGLDGEPWGAFVRTLTVVSRAPRPLYVNHPRPAPVPDDVVRSADDPHDARVWLCGHADEWWRATGLGLDNPSATWTTRRHLPARLRLLVDGETGMAVTS